MDVDALIAESLGPARREIEQLRALREDAQRSEVECTSRDKCVKVRQNLAGEVRTVEISPGTFDRHDEASLSRLLTEVFQATRSVSQQAMRKLTDEIRKERDAGFPRG